MWPRDQLEISLNIHPLQNNLNEEEVPVREVGNLGFGLRARKKNHSSHNGITFIEQVSTQKCSVRNWKLVSTE